MIGQILEMLQLAEEYEGNEVIETAKGKYQFTTNYFSLFKKAMKWQSRK